MELPRWKLLLLVNLKIEGLTCSHSLIHRNQITWQTNMSHHSPESWILGRSPRCVCYIVLIGAGNRPGPGHGVTWRFGLVSGGSAAGMRRLPRFPGSSTSVPRAQKKKRARRNMECPKVERAARSFIRGKVAVPPDDSRNQEPQLHESFLAAPRCDGSVVHGRVGFPMRALHHTHPPTNGSSCFPTLKRAPASS